ncbi:hypothetical protein Halar_1189 [halophilic archaeon DL31]|nr:hypothetical protein Halar_1189 [halophilic archaeon DL31]
MTGYDLPETVSEPEAAVESHLSAEISVGVASYDEPEITTDSGLVILREERAVSDGLSY